MPNSPTGVDGFLVCVTRILVCVQKSLDTGKRIWKVMGIHSQYLDTLKVAFYLLYDKKVFDQDIKSIITKSFLRKVEIETKTLTGKVELSTRKTSIVDGVVQYYHLA